jgi:hypothetical protein
VAAQLFDMACLLHIGLSLNSMSLIMMSGYITTALRQVCTAGPLINVSGIPWHALHSPMTCGSSICC